MNIGVEVGTFIGLEVGIEFCVEVEGKKVEKDNDL
jgi:hypothetical protein